LASLFVSAENKIQAVYGQQVILERQGRVHVLRVHLQGNWEDTIIRQVKAIGEMVREFSSFSRLPPLIEKQALAKLCQQAIALQEQAYPQIAFEFFPPQSPVFFLCDSKQMVQVFTNILKNSIEAIEERFKINPSPPGSVQLKLLWEPPHVIFEFLDKGVGFPEKGKERLEEPYITTKPKGTGLGLAIVKKKC